MKQFYKGFDLEAKRTKTITGGEIVYATATRRDDGWKLAAHPSDDTVQSEMDSLKRTVDDFYRNPEIYDAPKTKPVYKPAKPRSLEEDADEKEESEE